MEGIVVRADIVRKIRDLLVEYADLPLDSTDENTLLIGSQAVIKSRVVVELMLALEDYAEEELGFQFDWSSDSAMSEVRSVMRTVGTLADHLDSMHQRQIF